jgi:hypothetical protein
MLYRDILLLSRIVSRLGGDASQKFIVSPKLAADFKAWLAH